MEKIGQFLNKLRLNEKMNLREAAEKSGLSHSYIRYLEIGGRPGSDTPINATPETLKKLAKAYNYPYIDLLEKAGYIDEITEERKQTANESTIEGFIDAWFDPALAGLTYKNGEDRFHEHILSNITAIRKKYETLFEDNEITPSSFMRAIQKSSNVIQKFNLFNEINDLLSKLNNKSVKLEEALAEPVLSCNGVFLTTQEQKNIQHVVNNYLKEERGN